MIGNKYTGDNIAAEFMKIISSKSSPGKTLEKAASVENDLVEAAEGMLMESKDESPANNPIENALEAVENMLGDEGAPSADADSLSSVDQDGLDAHAAFNASEAYLIKGLGKIAGGLRRKDESFAADMVEATARSIYGDIMKEAAHRNNIMSGLSKVARELSSSGDNFASDLVKASMRRIKRG